MECGGTDLDLYVLDLLDSAETIAVEEHLLICESCRRELDSTVSFAQEMREALPILDEPEIDPDYGETYDRASDREAAWHPEFYRFGRQQ